MRDPGDTRKTTDPDTPAFLRTFADPRGDSAPMPFWMWNGELEEDEIRRQIGLMAAAGVKAFVIHAREGLETPYLSDQWFEMTKAAVEEAMAKGMKVFLYDELNWPSGYAGGKVIEDNPTKCAHHLARVTVDTNGRKSFRHNLSPGEQLVAAFSPDGEGGARAILPELVSPPGIDQPDRSTPETFGESEFPLGDEKTTKTKQNIPPNDSHIANIPNDSHSPIPTTPRKVYTPLRFPLPAGTTAVNLYISRPTSFSVTYQPGLRYTDLLDPEAVRLFISLTHDRYLRHLHDYFGTTILGFFTDEPGFYNNLHGCDPDTIPWTAGFPDHFRQLKGYDLLPRLGALWQPPAADDDADHEAARIRADYFDALADRYRSSYFQQLHDWCRANGLQLIGHLLGEEDLLTTARSQGDFFRHFRHLDQAGVDLVGQVSEEQSVSVRLGASAALHIGLGQLQSETFGIFGWRLTLEQMRYTTDWQAVRGLTRLIPHAFHYSMAGERYRECPPSLFFQNCWWPLYPGFQAYGRRLFAALEQGRPSATVALFYPLPAVWAGLSAGAEGEQAARRIDAAFRGLALALERAQIDFHILDGEMIRRAEVDEDGALALNGCRYTALILPECRALPSGMAEKLERFTRKGGMLAAVGILPELELADAGGETDPLREWSARLFTEADQGDGGDTGDTSPASSPGKGKAIFIPHEPVVDTSHPARRPRVLKLLRILRKIGAAVAPRIEMRATDRYKRWLSRQRDQSAETAAQSSPFAGLVDSAAAHCAPALRVLPPDPEIRHLRKELGGDDGGALVIILNQGESEKQFTAALADVSHRSTAAEPDSSPLATKPGEEGGLPGTTRLWRLEPTDGSITAIHRFSIDPAGRILLPLTLPRHGSALLFLEPSKPVTGRVEETNLDEALTQGREPASPPDLEGIAWSNGKKWARVVESGVKPARSSGKVAKQTRQEWILAKHVGELPNPMDFSHGWEIRFLPMEGGQFEDPLRDKWPKEMTLSNQPLQDWRTLGRGKFSGTAEYSITFELGGRHVVSPPTIESNGMTDEANGGVKQHPSSLIQQESGNIATNNGDNPAALNNPVALLELGDVRETAWVFLNGKSAGSLLWPPYSLRVEQFLRPGRNELTLVVTNTMANRLEPNPLPSGLLGPVRLVFGHKVRLELSQDERG